MSRQYYMTWVPAAKRWAKNYRGKNYAVSCKQLNATPTKEGSWRAANAWWLTKKAEIDAEDPRSPPPLHPFQAELNQLDAKLDWARQHAPDEVKGLEETRQEVARTAHYEEPQLPDEAVIAENLRLFKEQTALELPDGVDPEIIRYFFGNKRMWADRMKRSPVEMIAADQTLEHWSKVFLDSIKPQCKPGTFGIWQTHVKELINFKDAEGVVLLPTMRPEKINEVVVGKIGLHFAKLLGEKKIAPGTANAKIIKLRRFVRWLYGRRLIEELPRNLTDKSLRFRNPAKKIRLPKLAVVLDVLAGLPEMDRLFALLSLNCGMNQVDIAGLQQEQIEWTKGTLTRKRVKTEDHDDVPEVTYSLWPETLELLKKYRSDQPHVLLTERGTLLLERFERNGKTCKKDNITLRWKRLMRQRRSEAKAVIRFGVFRKVSSTLLERHPVYGRFSDYFLGHSPRSVKERHYAKPSNKLFARGLLWLGRKLKVIPEEAKIETPKVE